MQIIDAQVHIYERDHPGRPWLGRPGGEHWDEIFSRLPEVTGSDMVAAMDQSVLDKIVAGIPVGRLGTPEEMGHMVSFLVGEQAGFITGATLTANGGQYLAA